MSESGINYAVYLAAAVDGQPQGVVVNNVLWDGNTLWKPPEGCALVADPERLYPIGSTYDAGAVAPADTTSASSSTAG